MISAGKGRRDGGGGERGDGPGSPSAAAGQRLRSWARKGAPLMDSPPRLRGEGGSRRPRGRQQRSASAFPRRTISGNRSRQCGTKGVFHIGLIISGRVGEGGNSDRVPACKTGSLSVEWKRPDDGIDSGKPRCQPALSTAHPVPRGPRASLSPSTPSS